MHLEWPRLVALLEYIANVFHALILRKLSKVVLSVLVFIAALALFHLVHFTSPHGDIIGGWSFGAWATAHWLYPAAFSLHGQYAVEKTGTTHGKGETHFWWHRYYWYWCWVYLVSEVIPIYGPTSVRCFGSDTHFFPAIVFLGAISKKAVT